MSHVELPRPLEAYFAHAELEGTQHLRRFTITLPYFDGARLDRLQWWWSVTHGQQRVGGIEGLEPWRREAVHRFRQHIEHWLSNNRLRLTGEAAIPSLLPWEPPMQGDEAAGSDIGVSIPRSASA